MGKRGVQWEVSAGVMQRGAKRSCIQDAEGLRRGTKCGVWWRGVPARGGGGAGRGAHATRTAASLTFVGSSFDVAGQGLEVAQGQPQLLADTLSLALLVILLHALQDAAHIPFKASTQQQVSFIQNYVMHPT